MEMQDNLFGVLQVRIAPACIPPRLELWPAEYAIAHVFGMEAVVTPQRTIEVNRILNIVIHYAAS
jgi:hypothetical protein